MCLGEGKALNLNPAATVAGPTKEASWWRPSRQRGRRRRGILAAAVSGTEDEEAGRWRTGSRVLVGGAAGDAEIGRRRRWSEEDKVGVRGWEDEASRGGWGVTWAKSFMG
ncbi:hypothetical protein U9M48_009469 [Paspalum notatum var. saurae]|uniref:Uncharacterized protein n=1 Tax=Paspalum notatum var. saurae TaxID=547442 RepID=A0AAQ3SSR2_PASNO